MVIVQTQKSQNLKTKQIKQTKDNMFNQTDEEKMAHIFSKFDTFWIFVTILGTYVGLRCVRMFLYVNRLAGFSKKFHYPDSNNFFGVFPQFIQAARESKVSNSISEKLIEWRMNHTNQHPTKSWVMKITPFHQILSVGCPKLANFLLNLDPSCAVKGGFSEYLLSTDKRGFNEGLILMEASEWKKHRNLLKKLFSFKNLAQYIDSMDQSAMALVQSLTNCTGYASRSEGYFNPVQNVIRFTYEVMFKCIMGEEHVDCLSEHDSERTHDKNIAFFDAIGFAINWKVRNMPKAIIHSLFWKIPLLRKIFISNNPVLEDEMMAQKVRDEYITDILTVAAQKEEHEFGGMAKLLLNSRNALENNKESESETKSDGNKNDSMKITLANIKAHLFTFAFAGHETTSTAIRWCLYYLAAHPEWQEIIRTEFEELLATSNGKITSQTIKSATNTNAFINEVLRLSHVIDIIDTRKLKHDVTLPDGTIMPAGMQFQIDIANVHLNSDTWGANCKEFNPRRWLTESHENAAAMNLERAHLSFSAGKRNCIGKNFAIQEIKIFLFRLCQNVKIEKKGEAINQMEGVSWKPKAGSLQHRFTFLNQ